MKTPSARSVGSVACPSGSDTHHDRHRRAGGVAPDVAGVSWRLVASAYLRLVRVRVALRTRPFPEVQKQLLGRPAHQGRQPSADLAQLVSAVESAARHSVPQAMCLPRSLVLASMLLDHGHPARLQIGVRRLGDDLQAHAWVESDGVVVGDRPDVASLYRPLGAWSDLPDGASIGGSPKLNVGGVRTYRGGC